MKVVEDSCWRRGDLALEAGKENRQKLAYDTGENIQTLRKYALVASKYKPAMRIATLTFYHHHIVAAQEDRLDWLKQADLDGWSAATLRQNLREAIGLRKNSTKQEEEIAHITTATCPKCQFTGVLDDFEIRTDTFVKGETDDGV